MHAYTGEYIYIYIYIYMWVFLRKKLHTLDQTENIICSNVSKIHNELYEF
jgi:hypothetical protein